MKYKMVKVTWVDSLGSGSWIDKKNISVNNNEFLHESAGFLFHKDKHQVILIQSFAADKSMDYVNNYVRIPMRAVISVEPLRKGK